MRVEAFKLVLSGAAVVMFVLFVLAIERIRARKRPIDWVAVGFLSFFMIAVALIAILAWTEFARARDLDGRYADSPLKEWFGALRSEGWGYCCSDADGTAISDVDWRSKEGHYQVRLDGEWIDVPDYAVIKVPNLYGRAMVWPMGGTINHETRTLESSKGVTIRCFLPGPGA